MLICDGEAGARFLVCFGVICWSQDEFSFYCLWNQTKELTQVF